MYFACDSNSAQPPTCQLPWASQTQQLHTIEAWNEFERLAPLDPRISGLLLKRALLSTKLVNGSDHDRANLEAATRDYQAAFDRSDGLSGIRTDELLLGNLAETYMMLGRLDDAISTYLQSVAAGTARVSTIYGLAVALDRDGAGEQAIRRILDQGAVGFESFRRDLARGTVFFVPGGEERYYLALGSEAFGNFGQALGYWKEFVASGAHPEFQARAREHIDRLQKRQVHVEPPPPELEELILVKPAGLAALCALGVLGLATPAPAQSRRYPPQPVDKDAERAAKSDLWNAAIMPELRPYQELVRGASDAIERRTPDQTLEALKKLDAAILLLPREPAAYRLRGDVHLERQDWAKCAADYAAADAAAQRDDVPVRPTAELHLRLALCQARAGKLGDAEHTLAETVASGTASGELWLRLGEIRIAMGKLDEAIAALKSAISATDPPAQAMIDFMLAAAYDWARRPADALAEAEAGATLDRSLSTLQNPRIPPIGAGELDYMLALAYTHLARPEYVLVYFRRFVKTAPNSPWRRRAEEHLRDIKTSELPEAITRDGTAPLDVDAARTAVRRAMPQLRACLARFPAVVVEIEISHAGPRTPPTDLLRPRFFSPPDGVTLRRAVGELTDTELIAIDNCLQPLATRIVLPAVKERDTYYKARFNVIGP